MDGAGLGHGRPSGHHHRPHRAMLGRGAGLEPALHCHGQSPQPVQLTVCRLAPDLSPLRASDRRRFACGEHPPHARSCPRASITGRRMTLAVRGGDFNVGAWSWPARCSHRGASLGWVASQRLGWSSVWPCCNAAARLGPEKSGPCGAFVGGPLAGSAQRRIGQWLRPDNGCQADQHAQRRPGMVLDQLHCGDDTDHRDQHQRRGVGGSAGHHPRMAQEGQQRGRRQCQGATARSATRSAQ